MLTLISTAKGDFQEHFAYFNSGRIVVFKVHLYPPYEKHPGDGKIILVFAGLLAFILGQHLLIPCFLSPPTHHIYSTALLIILIDNLKYVIIFIYVWFLP